MADTDIKQAVQDAATSYVSKAPGAMSSAIRNYAVLDAWTQFAAAAIANGNAAHGAAKIADEMIVEHYVPRFFSQ